MYTLTSLLLLIAGVLLLRFVSQSAKRLKIKRYSPLWIALIWGGSVGVTLLFKHYYDVPLIVYLLFSTGIATISYLLLADVDVFAALVFSSSNTLVLLGVMFYFGMLGGRIESTLTSGDVQLVADNVCQCAANQACLDRVLPEMEKRILESQVFSGREALIAANAIARAHHCMQQNPIKEEKRVTFLEDWEKELEVEKKKLLIKPINKLTKELER